MKKMNLILNSFLQALGTLVYIAIVVGIMSNGDKIFSNDKGLLIGMAMLMLFVVSAAICGFLVFGKSIILFLENQKKEALKLLYFTIGWMAIFLAIILLISVALR